MESRRVDRGGSISSQLPARAHRYPLCLLQYFGAVETSDLMPQLRADKDGNTGQHLPRKLSHVPKALDGAWPSTFF
jgi:hypothetical protein